MEHKRQNFLSFWTAFCHFTPYGPRKSKLWENKKNMKILSFYKCVPQTTVIWCMVLEIWSATDRIFCRFGPFSALLTPLTTWNQAFEKMKKNACRYCHFTHVQLKWKPYDVWFLRHEAQETEFFIILDHFLPF